MTACNLVSAAVKLDATKKPGNYQKDGGKEGLRGKKLQVAGEIQNLESWIPAFAGMTGFWEERGKEGQNLDSGLRRNDEV